jgi:hypothetical protein
MINRSFFRRVERLETRLSPLDAPETITISYISPDGEVVDTHEVKVGCGTRYRDDREQQGRAGSAASFVR